MGGWMQAGSRGRESTPQQYEQAVRAGSQPWQHQAGSPMRLSRVMGRPILRSSGTSSLSYMGIRMTMPCSTGSTVHTERVTCVESHCAEEWVAHDMGIMAPCLPLPAHPYQPASPSPARWC